MPFPVLPPEPPSIIVPSRFDPPTLPTVSTPRSPDTAQLTLKQSVKPAPPEVLQATLADLSVPKALRDTTSGELGDASDLSPSAQAPASQPSTPQPPSQLPQPDLPSPSPAPLPAPSNAVPPANIPVNQLGREGFLELKADRQDYDAERQIFTAAGNVSLKFRGALLTGDRIQVNLLNRLTLAEGNVVLTRGQQVLRGQRFRYNLIQEEGIIERASGDVFLPSTASDFNPSLPTDITAGTVPGRSVGDRNTAVQPAQQVSSPGGVNLTIGSRRNVAGASVIPRAGGEVRRARFEADEI